MGPLANLIIMGVGSSDMSLLVVDDSLFEEMLAAWALLKDTDVEGCYGVACKLLYGNDGELTSKNPRVLKTIYCQTFVVETEDMPAIKRVLTLPAW